MAERAVEIRVAERAVVETAEAMVVQVVAVRVLR